MLYKERYFVNANILVHGLGSHTGSHIEILNKSCFFFLFEKLEEDIFVFLLFFIDLFTIFKLISNILNVNFGNHILLMTPSGGI